MPSGPQPRYACPTATPAGAGAIWAAASVRSRPQARHREPSGPQPQYAPARKRNRQAQGAILGRSRSTLPDRPAYSISSAPSGPQPQYARKIHARKPNPIRHFQERINKTAAASPPPRSWRLGMAKLQALRQAHCKLEPSLRRQAKQKPWGLEAVGL